MRHPDQLARHLRQRSTWREPGEGRGSRDHDALDWTDAALALGGCSPLAGAAFGWVHVGDRASRRQLEQHLLGLVARSSLPDGLDPDALVQLALDEQHAPENQRKDRLRALVLGVDARTWKHTYQRPHARLLIEIEALVSDAWRVARDRLEAA